MKDPIQDSIGQEQPAKGPLGQLAHPEAIAHGMRLQYHFYHLGEHAWNLVGNGLSNQTFIEGPEGIIAIDSGESVEEMRSALAELRHHTQTPIVACIYTHFHYINGTRAILEEPGSADLQIYAHHGIEANLLRFGGEVAPRSGRGIVHQFGLVLPEKGEDALLHCGLGRFFRNPEHAPFTAGYIPAQHTFDCATTLTIAGLQVEISPAPSDANDSITIWFPQLKVCVNNLVWPSLFNIYAIRGEEYRDPRILLTGIDAIYDLGADHLIGTHGPPLSGQEVAPAVLDYRDAIQFIWDQTVRGINQGLGLSELTQRVQLPKRFNRSYVTRQFYGLVEHHVRQIHNGLFGWHDEDPGRLFPLPEKKRCSRLVAGFGGVKALRTQIDDAITTGDLRWAAEMASWLTTKHNCAQQDKQRLATVLRLLAQQTTSANVRNWCLTRALDLEGKVDLSRFCQHRFRLEEVLHAAPTRFIAVLRVLLDPDKALGIADEMAWHFATGERAGLAIRGQVAVPTDGSAANLGVGMSHETWAQILAGRTTLAAAEAQGLVSISGERQQVFRFFAAFDHASFV